MKGKCGYIYRDSPSFIRFLQISTYVLRASDDEDVLQNKDCTLLYQIVSLGSKPRGIPPRRDMCLKMKVFFGGGNQSSETRKEMKGAQVRIKLGVPIIWATAWIYPFTINFFFCLFFHSFLFFISSVLSRPFSSKDERVLFRFFFFE